MTGSQEQDGKQCCNGYKQCSPNCIHYRNGKKVTRGAAITISQEMFNEIISKALGFEYGEIEVLHCSNAYYNRAFELTIKSDNEIFPVVHEGRRFPNAQLDVMSYADSEGKVTHKVIGVIGYD